MKKSLIDALISVYRNNSEEAKCDVASFYLHGAAGAVENHRIAFQIFSELKTRKSCIISKNDDANLCLGLFSYLDKKYDVALKHIICLPADKVRSDILFNLGNWAYDNRKYIEASKLYSGFLSTYGNASNDIIDFIKNRGLSSIFYAGDKEKFYRLFSEKVNNGSRLTAENIKLFCSCIRSRKIDRDAVKILEKIYSLNSVDASMKKEIAEYLAFVYETVPQKAFFWATLSNNQQLIKKQKNILASSGIRKRFKDSLQQQTVAAIHTVMVFLLFIGGYAYYSCMNKISVFIHIPVFIGVAFFVFNLLRYIVLKEDKKFLFISRVSFITLLLTLLPFLHSNRLPFFIQTALFAIDFTLMYTVFFYMAEQLKKLQLNTIEYIEKITRSFK